MQHAAWETARNAILDLAAAGPATIALVGAPGTGKSWLLRELAATLGDHGFPTMTVLQGDLPVAVSEGAALLVDEALRMPEAELDALLAQQASFVVLADVERFADIVSARPHPPIVVPIRALTDREAHGFAVGWLKQHGLAPADVESDVLDRVIVHAGGTVRLITQLLGAAVAMRMSSGQDQVTAADVDQAAEMRQVWPPTQTPPPEPMPVRDVAAPPVEVPHVAVVNRRARNFRRAAFRGMAVAACLVLAWVVRPAPPAPVELAERPPHVGLPPLQVAESSTPSPATRPDPSMAHSVAADPAVPAIPPVVTVPPVLADATPDPVPLDAALETATNPPVPVAASIATRRAGGPGIVLLAQRGDTLESLYNDFYRDRSAPPYAEIVAINPRPIRPGAIVIFPEPQGGWSASQR